MSQVRNALKRADQLESKEVQLGQPESQVAALVTLDVSVQPAALVSLKEETRGEPADEAVGTPTRDSSALPRWPPLWFSRMAVGDKEALRCSATTRRGDPCRAAAMDNGLCRMHGSARVREFHQRNGGRQDQRVGVIGTLARFISSRLRPAS